MNRHNKEKCQCCSCKAYRGDYEGKQNPFFGKHHTKKAKQKMSRAHIGKKMKPFTKQHKNNLSKTKIGTNNPMYGLKGTSNPNYGSKRNRKTKILMSLIRGGTGIPYENRVYTERFYNIRDKIRKRDNYICQLCKISETEYRRKLDIHHIDYNKNNCNENNLIALCCGCNAKANFNRKYWKNFYRQKVLKIREVI